MTPTGEVRQDRPHRKDGKQQHRLLDHEYRYACHRTASRPYVAPHSDVEYTTELLSPRFVLFVEFFVQFRAASLIALVVWPNEASVFEEIGGVAHLVELVEDVG